MSKHKIASALLGSPQDSLQQSTREPSTRLGERSSVDTSTFGNSASRRLLGSGATVGGGSYKSYLLDHLTRMYSDIESTTRRLELEQRRLARLDKDLGLAECEHSQKKQRYGIAAHIHADAVHGKFAQVKALERQLEKDIAELNEGNAENERLREQIDTLRKERKILDTVFSQLERGIGCSRRAIDRLKSGISDDQRLGDDAKQKAQALVKMLERERRTFGRDADGFKRAVQREGEVQREQEKLARSSERVPEGGRGPRRRAYMVADEEEAFSEQAMHRRILKLSFLNTIQRRHIKQHQKNIEVFEQAFATIKSSTGISDIEEIVKIFIALEQRNFSLLTYVNQLNREIESIEIRNRDLQGQLENHRHQETACAAKKDVSISEIVSQITRTRAATEEKERLVSESASGLDDCQPIVWSIVKYLKEQVPRLLNVAFEGDPPPLKTAPPDEHDNNMGHLLTFVEECLMQFRVCLAPDALGQHRAPPPKSQTAGAKKPADLPSAHLTGDDSDDDPDTGLGDRPWTRNELKERAQAMIQRRRKKPGPQGKPLHEDKRQEAEDEAGTRIRATSSDYPGAAKETIYADTVLAGGAAPSRGPVPSLRGPSESFLIKDVGEDDGDRKAPFRDEMWWRGQSKEKKR